MHRAGLLCAALACTACVDPDELGALVPPTADEDPLLPQLVVEVAGQQRTLHLEELGDPGAPPLFFLHGTFSDYRSMRPIAMALAERYHVVIWDQRGAGLSERIEPREFSLASAVEEIDVIAERFAADEPLTLFGHSWGGALATLYISERPGRVRQAILAEPMGVDSDLMNERAADVIQFHYFNQGWNDQARLGDLLSSTDHERLDFRALQTLHTGLANYFCDPEHAPPFPIWRVGALLELRRSQVLLDGTRFAYDFAFGLDAFENEVLILGGECGALGADFQRRQVERFVDARVVEIPDAGHRLIVEQPERVLQAAQSYLEEYVR